jgi:predicted ATP-grasp superfamily ATP-dependent carboligase
MFEDVSSPVLILRADHYSALGVMRTLGRVGVKTFAVHADSDAAAFRSRYCTGRFIWDLDSAPERDSVQFLLDIGRRLGRRPLLLATNDETALFMSRHSSALGERFAFPKNNPQLVKGLYDKREMYVIARRLNIPTADTIFPRSRQDVLSFLQTARFPVMLKAGDNIAVSRRTGKKMVITRSPEDLLRHYDEMEDAANPALMIQEYIPGGDDSVWMFNGYFDEESNCLFGITGRKIHQTPVYTGMTALGVCLPNSIVYEQTFRLVKGTGYKGILDIGFRFDCRDGSYKLLDVNPRLGATFRLFVGHNGMDVVRAQYLHLTGQTVPLGRIRIGRRWMVEDADIVSTLHYFRDRAIGVGEWISGYRRLQECAFFASDDLMPFIHMASRFVMKPFRRFLPSGKEASTNETPQAIGIGRG